MDDLSPNLIKFMTVTRLEESFATKTGREIPNFKDVDPYRKQAHDFLNAFLANYRVAAFCDRANSPLLWSHYGNSYKGACLHFLGRAFPHQIIYRPKLGYVTYSNQRPHLPLSLALRMSDTKKFSKNSKHKLNRQELEKFCFFTKGLDWQYENEIRVIYNVKEMQHLAFQNDGLISITLGPRMPEKDKDKLSSIIRNSPFSGISIMNAQLAKNTFAVNSNY